MEAAYGRRHTATATATATAGAHVDPTVAKPVNTDPSSPADYQTAILTWVRERLAHPPTN